MKDLLILCTKNVSFSFNGDIYIQCDGIAMGSPLGPLPAGIFMQELERSIVPKLSEHMMLLEKICRRYYNLYSTNVYCTCY